MRKFSLVLSTAALLAWSSTAHALAYTLASSIAFTNGTASGTLNPVTDVSGTSICLAGSCSTSVAQDWLIFTVTMDAGSTALDQIGVSVADSTNVQILVGGGHYSDPAETPTGGAITPASPFPSSAQFDYIGSVALNLQAGETTDRLFATYNLGTLPGTGISPIFAPGTALFMLRKVGSTSFSVNSPIVLVPEPGTLLLLGGGVLGLALVRRRRS